MLRIYSKLLVINDLGFERSNIHLSWHKALVSQEMKGKNRSLKDSTVIGLAILK